MRKLTILLSVILFTVIHQSFATTYYVDAARSDDSGNGLGWATAKKTIQAAVDVAVAGDSVVVTNGVYNTGYATTSAYYNGDEIRFKNRVLINKAITVRSVNGAAATIIEGLQFINNSAAIRCVYMSQGVLDGFTLQKGTTQYTLTPGYCEGGGVNMYGSSADAEVRNSIIQNCQAHKGGGAAFSRLYNCTLSGNTGNDRAGGALESVLNTCTLVNNSAGIGAGAFNGTLNNCILSGNTATDRGGGSYGSTLNNCLLIGNVANQGGGIAYGGMNNCTVVGNRASNDSGYGCGTYGSGGNNCIVWGNTKPSGTVDNNSGSGFSYSCTTPSVSGVGNISSAPLFLDSANGNYKLQAISPCINAGNNAVVQGLSDLSGAPRVQAGVVDMGAFEFDLANEIASKFGLETNSVAFCGNAQNSGISFSNTTVTIRGALIGHNASSGFTFTSQNQGRLTFRWNVSSEYYFDTLSFYVDDVLTAQISGKNVTWTSVTNTVMTAGPHIFKWEYAKDADTSVGQDTAWIADVVWTPRSSLTVEQGSGDGDYFIGDVVPVTADVAPEHFTFDRWTGDTNGVADVFASTTPFTMPGMSALLTATYTPILYALSVTDGSGSGAYPHGSNVEIGAALYEGKRFYRWTGDVDTVTDVWAATTTVQTVGHTLHVGATYSYPLTVNNGTGSGWYPAGTAVSVAAGDAPLYTEFSCWTGDAAAFLVDSAQRETTLAMPANTATLTPSYVASISRVSGSYGRDYVLSGTEGGVTADVDAGSPSGTPAVKLGGTGVVPDSSFAAFETVVTGSGTVTFWWKVSSEGGADYLKFLVDGNLIQSISGTKATWAQITNRVEGADMEHTLRWEYVKDVSVPFGSDAGWVDDIVWTGDVPSPVIRPDIQTANLDTSLLTLSFLGERGIPYTVYSNATLSSIGWEPMALDPEEKGETNGLFRFEAIIAPNPGQPSCFYRVLGGHENRYLIIDLSGGTNAVSYPVSYVDAVPVGGWADEYKTTKLVMRKISKGTFTMGGRATDYPGAVDDGLHTVTLTKDFYIGVFEVTQRQWELVMGNKPSYFDNTTYYATRPVDQVSYYDIRENPSNADDPSVEWPSNTNVHATSFMGKLRAKTGVSTLDLPTESQWEYACRANTTTALNSGYNLTSTDSDTHMDAVGRYYSNGGLVDHVTWPPSNCTIANATTKVGSYLPNILGLYDMHGNAWEWCLDWGGMYSGSTIDPVGPVSGTARLFRGGGWYEGAAGCRSARRVMHDPSRRAFENGFRLTMTLP